MKSEGILKWKKKEKKIRYLIDGNVEKHAANSIKKQFAQSIRVYYISKVVTFLGNSMERIDKPGPAQVTQVSEYQVSQIHKEHYC